MVLTRLVEPAKALTKPVFPAQVLTKPVIPAKAFTKPVIPAKAGIWPVSRFLPSQRSDVSEYLFLAGPNRIKTGILIDIHHHAATKSTLFDQFV